jgi:hypothetical protein
MRLLLPALLLLDPPLNVLLGAQCLTSCSFAAVPAFLLGRQHASKAKPKQLYITFLRAC